ncbi:MAG: helix-turn-helix transcriptional regulator [Planctomycetota bacterium]
MSDRDNIGELLATARKAKRLTQKDVAVRLGVALSTLQGWEYGKHSVPADNLRDLCDLYDCSADVILGRCDGTLRAEAVVVDRGKIDSIMTATSWNEIEPIWDEELEAIPFWVQVPRQWAVVNWDQLAQYIDDTSKKLIQLKDAL